MAVILGLDGGGSKTFAVVVNEHGDLLGKGVSGHGNYQNASIGIDGAVRNYRLAIDAALRDAGLAQEDVDYAEFGLAGYDRPKDFAILDPGVASLGFENYGIVCDTYAGLRAGSRDNTGVVLVCGSGTNAAGRNAAGKMVQVGGFGYIFGDTAGGHHLAAEAFRAACRGFEGRGPETILTKLVADFYGMASMGDVMGYFWDNDLYSVDIKLCEVLHQAEIEGDEVAREILSTVGKELGIAANAVIRHVGGFTDADIPIVLVGSVVQKGRSPALLGALKDEVGTRHERFHISIPEMEPVYGAVLLGFDAMGIRAGSEIERKFISYGGYQQ